MTAAQRAALDDVNRRLGHIAVIADLISASDDSPIGSAVRGLVWMLNDLDERLDLAILDAAAVPS